MNQPQTLETLRQQIISLAHSPEILLERLPQFLPHVLGPRIDFFTPIHGQPGTSIEIHGRFFSPDRTQNIVTIGGVQALVLEATPTVLRVIAGLNTQTGPLKVEVGTQFASGPIDFIVSPSSTVATGDGPPIFYEGRFRPLPGTAPAAGLDPQGTIRALIAVCYAADTVPSNFTTVRNELVSEFDQAADFYDEVSFGDTDLQIDYTDWIALTGNFSDYVDATIENFAWPADRIMAEAAQGALDQGLDLDNFDFMGVVLFLNGGFVRAWGGWSQSNFSFNGNGLNINITADHEIALTAIGDNADWGRFAHEVAHSLVTAGAVLGEDVYRSDLIDPDVATATRFDLMGSHDSHPCFSGHFMKQLNYYDPANISELNWDRNPFSQSFTLVAHGLTQNTDPARRHLLRINVGAGLSYYLEVRQRMDPATAHFDTDIPVSGPNNGGLVVTKVFTDTVNVNQELRFVTLLHEVVTQDSGAVIEDPARALTITVNGVAQANPLALSVTVAWAQVIADDVDGTFDLRLTQTSVPWVSDDIWVDRQPFGITNETDGNGNIVATREKPRPGEINHLYAQVFNSGPESTSNVKLTYYAITPPGVGDNGAWAPIGQRTLAMVASGSSAADHINWTPTVGEHTCLKVHASAQFGEITAGNNQAQENVFYFAPPASSPPEPVRMKIAVRNPLEEDTAILLAPANVPIGYLIHVPHRWVNVPAKGQRDIEITVIPYLDIETYRKEFRFRSADIRVRGFLPHSYLEEVEGTGVPAFTHRAIGGLTMNITPKRRAEIDAQIDKERKGGIGVLGSVRPAMAGQKVTVCVQPVNGQRFSVETMTDPQGRFRVFIDPRRQTNVGARPWEGQRSSRLQAIYEVWCETFDAKDLAFAQSGRLYFDFRRAVKGVPVQPRAAVLAETVVRPPVPRELVESVLHQSMAAEGEPVPANVSASEPPANAPASKPRRYRTPNNRRR